MVAAELPFQVVAADEAAQSWVERPDVVILQVDLDEGLPVVGALVQVHLVEHVAREIEISPRSDMAELGLDVTTVVLEHHAVPGSGGVVVEVQAGVVVEQRRTEQLALQVVGPAVQRADDLASGTPSHLTASAQHQRLAVSADVGDQFHALRRAHQGPALALLGQCIKIAHLRH